MTEPNMWIMKIRPENKYSTDDYFHALFLKEGAKNLIGYTKEDGKIEAYKELWLEMAIGDLIVVMEGRDRVHGVVEIVSTPFDSKDYVYEEDWFIHRRKVRLIQYFNPAISTRSQTNIDTIIRYSGEGAMDICDEIWDRVRSKYYYIKNMDQTQPIVDLLKYKKQIILQGPPGTGKTRLAENIADVFISENKLSPDIIREVFHIGMEVSTVTAYSSFRIMSYSTTHVLIKLVSTGSEYNIPFSEIIGAYYKKMWLNAEIKNGYDTYTAAMGKYLHSIDIQERYLKLIQFHPSYAYEDFVRGIRAKNIDGQLAYETENMLLGQFASLAYENYLMHTKEPQLASKETWLQDMFDLFTQHVEEAVYGGERYAINDKVYIREVEDDAFRYTGDVWATEHGHRMKFTDIKQLFLANVTSRQEIKSVMVSGLAKQHATYYFIILERFREFLKEQPPFVALKEKAPLKNFVLIIDEINRANLSAVLGELIYALEYRGRALDGIYELDGSRKIVLPPNLFIIGTMNTADRSVGNIDYAIRRRFAFVNVPPAADVIMEVVKDETVRNLANILFDDVAALFTPDYLIADFKAEEVQLGHSYFLAETMAQLVLKLEYEIKPILYEYVKDGVLNELARTKIEMLTV